MSRRGWVARPRRIERAPKWHSLCCAYGKRTGTSNEKTIALGLAFLFAGILSALGAEDLELSATLRFDRSGVTEPLLFHVPRETRSLSITVEGATTALYALQSLVTADGVDRVGLGGVPAGTEMRRRYYDDQAGQMAGSTYQAMRLGTFSFNYPMLASHALPEGVASLSVATDREFSSPAAIKIRILRPLSNPTLHLNLLAHSNSFSESQMAGLSQGLNAIFAPAGVRIVFDQVKITRDSAYRIITDFSEPQETPTSHAARLATAGISEVGGSHALNVFVVDALPSNIGGMSLGVPGPPIPSNYYFGVLVRHRAAEADFSRLMAHEICHFLGLPHVVSRGTSGTVYPDPFSDTEPNGTNLMESRVPATSLSAQQIVALRQSPLLTDH
jgi:hypothetical protein